MLWRFLRTKRFIDSYSTSRDSWSNASPLFLNHPLIRFGSSEKILEKWKPKEKRVYSNRRKLDVKVPKVDHVRCQGFSFYAAKMWNKLPDNIKEITDPIIFKARIKKHIWDIQYRHTKVSPSQL